MLEYQHVLLPKVVFFFTLTFLNKRKESMKGNESKSRKSTTVSVRWGRRDCHILYVTIREIIIYSIIPNSSLVTPTDNRKKGK